MWSSAFSASRYLNTKLAAATTTAAATGLFSAYSCSSDCNITATESATASTYWGLTAAQQTRRKAQVETTKTNADEASRFEGQCLKRQLYKPKVPYPAWDYNWDGRMTEETSLKGHLCGKAKAVNNTKKTRHIILVRHGQYDEDAGDDSEQKLTAIGRQQAIKTGKRLAAMAKGSTKFSDSSLCGPLSISTIQASNMTRAKETANLIAREMARHQLEVTLEQPDSTLNEVMPAPMIPARPEARDAEACIDEDRERVEEAFQKYFYREVDDAHKEQDGGDVADLDKFEVVVCHGNLIRYFFCRALQIPPEAWLRMSIYNCSMTYLTIRPNGSVSARMLGDIGHLDYDESTYSSLFGFKW